MADKPRAIVKTSIIRAPAISPSKDELKKLSEPDIIDTMCAHLSSGGTLVDLSEAWNVRFAVLAHWVENDPLAYEKFQQSVLLRDEWMKSKLLQQLRRIIDVDLRKAFNADGSMRPVAEIPREIMDCFASIDFDELFEGRGAEREQVGVTKKVKFWNKLQAIHDMGVELGMFKERKEFTAGESLEQLIAKSWAPPVVVSTAPPTTPAPSTIVDAEILPSQPTGPIDQGEGENTDGSRA